MMIFSDEILKEMVRITDGQSKGEFSKEASNDLKMDESQFAPLRSHAEDLPVTSVPLIDNIRLAVDYDHQDKELLKEKKRAVENEDIIDLAHPEPAFMADGPMGTGVVENQNEQHAKILNVIYKMPTGFHFNTMAGLVEGLSKVATTLDDKGDKEAAQKADEMLSFFLPKKR
jgi:hypothetical protein